MEATSLDDQPLSGTGMEPPVALPVRVGQRAARDGAAKIQTVGLVRHGHQAGLDAAQTLPMGQPGERHGQALVATREAPNTVVAAVRANTAVQHMPRSMGHQLGEHHLAFVHPPLPSVGPRQDEPTSLEFNSNARGTICPMKQMKHSNICDPIARSNGQH